MAPRKSTPALPGVPPRPSLNGDDFGPASAGAIGVAGGTPPALIERAATVPSGENWRPSVAGGTPPALIERGPSVLGAAAEPGVAGGTPPALIERARL